MTSRNTVKTYRGAMVRLMRSAEAIARVCGRQPVLFDIIRALSLRSRTLSKQSANVDIYALRHYVNAAIGSGDGSPPSWPEGIQPQDWMTRASAEEMSRLLDFASLARAKFMQMASTIAKEIGEEAKSTGTDIGDPEIMEVMSRVIGSPVSRENLKDAKPITHREVAIIEMLLSKHDPELAIPTLEKGKVLDVDGLTRIFASVLWDTGMRPVEIWNSLLLVPRPDQPMTEAVRTMIRENPRQAILGGHMTPVEQLTRSPSESLGAVAFAAMNQAQAPALLVIRSAKQTNANAQAKSEMRIQILENAPARAINMIAIAAQLRHQKVPEERKEAVRKMVNVNLREIRASEPSLAPFNLTIYAFRHAFATRVKRIFEHHEAAALIGHTSLSSVYRYGKRRDSTGTKKPGRASQLESATQTGWLPRPDPGHAALIKATWDAKIVADLAARPAERF